MWVWVCVCARARVCVHVCVLCGGGGEEGGGGISCSRDLSTQWLVTHTHTQALGGGVQVCSGRSCKGCCPSPPGPRPTQEW